MIAHRLLLAAVVVLACAPSAHARRKKEVVVPPVPTWTPAPAPPAERAVSSLWSADTLPWADDRRARRENDLVLVRIVERSMAASKVLTKTKRDHSASLGVPSFFGLIESTASEHLDPSSLLQADAKNDFTGDGTTGREESLTTLVTGRVVAVLPNGNLHVEAAREIKINNERQYLLLAGVVRPTDVAFDNSIRSTQMADLRIVFAGAGDLSKIQKKGWFMKALSWLLPF
jgi:flagellar L-ring protein precursor FlgH